MVFLKDRASVANPNESGLVSARATANAFSSWRSWHSLKPHKCNLNIDNVIDFMINASGKVMLQIIFCKRNQVGYI